MAETVTAYVGLGSNLGNRRGYIDDALNMLNQSEGIEVVRISDFIETTPLGPAEQPDFLNAVAEVQTTLSLEDFFARLMSVETKLERTRTEKWGPRNIDLDLLLFGDHLIDKPELKVPHRQMHLRSFALKGLCQIAPELKHPTLGVTVTELARRLNDCDFALVPDRPQLISIAGVIGVGKTTLAQKLTEPLGAQPILEPYDKNPFLPAVYAGNKDLALASQLFFFTSRLKQLSSDELQKGRVYVTDYVFEKELIYARRQLEPRQLALYEQIYERLAGSVIQPVLTIYLTDTPQNCLTRIHKRNRPYEQKIKLDFLAELAADYDKLFAQWRTSPLLRIDKADFDCTRAADVENLLRQVKAYVVT